MFVAIALSMVATVAQAQPEAEPVPSPDPPAVPDPSVEQAFFARVRAGIEHYRAGRWQQALREFDAALDHSAPDSERASVEFNAGACLFALERFAEAKQRFVRSADLDPDAGTLARLNAGLAAARAGDFDFAAAQLAIRPETEPERARHAELRSALQSARSTEVSEPARSTDPAPAASAPPESEPDARLPMAGVHGWLATTGGYDSNAAQSGVSETIGSSSTNNGASGFASALGSLHATHHFSNRHAGRLYYLGDWLGLLSTPVRDLSLQSHTVGVGAYSALGDHRLLRVGGGASATISGLEQLEPMLVEGFVDLRLQWDPAGPGRTRLDARVGATGGLGDWQYLTGPNVDGSFTHRIEWERVEVGFAAGGRYTGLGTVRTTLETGDLPDCTVPNGGGQGQGANVPVPCTGQTYVIPLSWAAPRVGLDLLGYPYERLGLGARAGFEYRMYTGESYVTRVPSSRKRRADARWRVSASAELDLDRRGHVTALLDYSLLVSHSNVAYDRDEPDHELDYDDRSFAQHIAEAGLLLAF